MSQTVPTAIDALPTAPSTSSPSTFAALADAFVAALATLRTQTNNISTVNYNNAVDAYNNAVAALASAVAAAASQSAAAVSAASAVNAPGTSGTSTTSLLVGTGAKSLTTQTGKSWAVGQPVVIAYTTTPTTFMHGTITAYNSGSGALDVSVSTISGSGTQAAWTIALAGPSVAERAWAIKTAAYTTLAGDRIQADTNAVGAWTLKLPAVGTAGDRVMWKDYANTFSTANLTIDPQGGKINGITGNYICDQSGELRCADYIDSTQGWLIS